MAKEKQRNKDTKRRKRGKQWEQDVEGQRYREAKGE